MGSGGGFFDWFNDPNTMRALLGTGETGAPPPGYYPPQSRGPVGGTVGDTGPIMPPQQPMPQQAQIGSPGGLAPRQPPFPGAPPQMPQQGLPGGPSGPSVDPTGPPGGMLMTLREAAGGSPGGPLADAAGIGGIGSDAARTPGIPQPPWGGGAPTGLPPGPPMQIGPQGGAPSMPPGGPPPMQPPPFSGAIGTPQPNAMQRFSAGIGPGLTAASNSWNKPALAAAMGGAGGALEGGTKEMARQRAEDRATAKEHFDQSSTAFKDMIAARSADNMEEWKKAQAKYLNNKADAVAAGANTPGKQSYMNSPHGQMMGIEREANKMHADAQKTAREQFKLNSTPEARQKEILDDLQRKRDEYAQKRYQQVGIDPSAQQKLKTMGMSPDNYFEPRTAEDLHLMVQPAVKNPKTGEWEGGWFRNPSNGKIMQFTKPDFDAHGPMNKKSDATNNDDLAAMSG